MKIIAINGSPRTGHNTGTLLNKAVEGAISNGAEVEVINLYKLNYKGCTACFSCKRKGSKTLHSCAVRDDLTPVLEKIKLADAVIFASPIYFYDLSGEMRSFLERLLFPSLPYDISVTDGTYFPKKLQTAFIYTMGVTEGGMQGRLKDIENFIQQIFRLPIKTLHSSNNYPFVDSYTNYESTPDIMKSIAKSQEELFPLDCERAFNLGVEIATQKA